MNRGNLHHPYVVKVIELQIPIDAMDTMSLFFYESPTREKVLEILRGGHKNATDLITMMGDIPPVRHNIHRFAKSIEATEKVDWRYLDVEKSITEISALDNGLMYVWITNLVY